MLKVRSFSANAFLWLTLATLNGALVGICLFKLWRGIL